ncbi:uncharacterized protein LOC126699558 [Quercus robur]|uniref:uncharacterized protein LOC126699558 n=1 Tax=Quercus robur TaxID=38942 RepID=UPI002161CDB3|nr:uncharacterized protein LOC126699558 [Quercus robur]
MSNPSSAGSNSPEHSLGSSESASSDHPPSPPPSPVHPPLLFPIHPLPPQVFIPEELKAEEDVEDAAIAAFKDAPIRRKEEDVEGEEEEEEEEEEEDEKEMEYQALDYPREDSGDNSDTYAPQSP